MSRCARCSESFAAAFSWLRHCARKALVCGMRRLSRQAMRIPARARGVRPLLQALLPAPLLQARALGQAAGVRHTSRLRLSSFLSLPLALSLERFLSSAACSRAHSFLASLHHGQPISVLPHLKPKHQVHSAEDGQRGAEASRGARR
jgi:hypothetical protein